MNVKVISIIPEYEPILPILFPDYSITEDLIVSSHFITHKQVVSKVQRDMLECTFSDCVIISNQIFDEVWDETKIKNECIAFARTRFKSRRTKFEPSKDSFVEDCKNFIVGVDVEEEQGEIFELFESLGSNSFPVKYFPLIAVRPYQQVFAALITFISKLDKESSNVYFKKKAFLYKDKIDRNMLSAVDTYNMSLKGDGLAECMFIMNLFV